jgi:hypothetical protein
VPSRAMNSARVAHANRPAVTSEVELTVLSRVYALAVQKYQESQKAAKPAQLQNGRGKEFDTKEGGQDDLTRYAIHGAEGDRTEQTRKEEHGFVHS